MVNVEKLREVIQLLYTWDAPKPWWETVNYTRYQIILAIVLSNRTNYRKVKRFVEDFTRRCSGFDCIASMTIEELQAELKPLGLVKMRARLLKELSEVINSVGGIEAFLNLTPERARELLLKVTGIGSKTADMILVALFHQQYFVVDTHILRIMKRVGILEPSVKSLYEARMQLEPYIPKNFRTEIHMKLVILGQTVCKPRSPDCSKCVLRQVCSYASS